MMSCDLTIYNIIIVARAETSARLKGAEGYEQEGVSGLKALGVRDLGYKMAFLANNVLQSKTKVRQLIGDIAMGNMRCGQFGGQEVTGDEITVEKAKEMMRHRDWEQISSMTHDHNLYQNLVQSMFPTIHGNNYICMSYMASVQCRK